MFCTFRKVGAKDTYASVFCTGNMRTCAESFYMGLVRKDSEALRRALRFTVILAAFFAGALLTAVLCSFIHEKAIWAVNVLFILIGIKNYCRTN